MFIVIFIACIYLLFFIFYYLNDPYIIAVSVSKL